MAALPKNEMFQTSNENIQKPWRSTTQTRVLSSPKKNLPHTNSRDLNTKHWIIFVKLRVSKALILQNPSIWLLPSTKGSSFLKTCVILAIFKQLRKLEVPIDWLIQFVKISNIHICNFLVFWPVLHHKLLDHVLNYLWPFWSHQMLLT